MTTKIVSMVSVAFGSSALTGRSTEQGARQDISKAGSNMSNEAQEHKK